MPRKYNICFARLQRLKVQGKVNPVSPICVQIARFDTFKMRAVHTPNDHFACIWYSKPSINFCGGQMRPHTTRHFIRIPTSPARISDERWVPFSSFFNAGDNQIDIHVNPSPSDIDERKSMSFNGDAVTLCNYCRLICLTDSPLNVFLMTFLVRNVLFP